MQFSTLSVLSLAAGLASAVTDHKVLVGQSGTTFTPNSLNASVGDTVTFHFYPQSHNVVQAAFATPCTPLSGGFYSGFHATTSGEANVTYMITVNDTKPIWFYCSRAKHCQSGMVGVINQAATGDKTIAAFTTLAANATNNTTPTGVVDGSGGMIMANTNTTSGATSLMGSSTVTISSLFALAAGVSMFMM